MPTRRLLRSDGSRSSRVTVAARAIAPRPKIAAGLVTVAILQVAAHFGVDWGVLGLQQRTVEGLITFGVMWAWRDPFAVPLPELPLGATQLPGDRPHAVPVTFADRTQALIVRDRIAGEGGTQQTADTVAAIAAIDAALERSA